MRRVILFSDQLWNFANIMAALLLILQECWNKSSYLENRRYIRRQRRWQPRLYTRQIWLNQRSQQTHHNSHPVSVWRHNVIRGGLRADRPWLQIIIIQEEIFYRCVCCMNRIHWLPWHNQRYPAVVSLIRCLSCELWKYTFKANGINFHIKRHATG